MQVGVEGGGREKEGRRAAEGGKRRGLFINSPQIEKIDGSQSLMERKWSSA